MKKHQKKKEVKLIQMKTIKIIIVIYFTVVLLRVILNVILAYVGWEPDIKHMYLSDLKK
jgi:hypothetical protein